MFLAKDAHYICKKKLSSILPLLGVLIFLNLDYKIFLYMLLFMLSSEVDYSLVNLEKSNNILKSLYIYKGKSSIYFSKLNSIFFIKAILFFGATLIKFCIVGNLQVNLSLINIIYVYIVLYLQTMSNMLIVLFFKLDIFILLILTISSYITLNICLVILI